MVVVIDEMLQTRAPWSTMPPVPRDRMQNQPTLLFSWWCTTCAAAIILLRICGRKIRSNELFREDWIMLAALVPLFIRMTFIHFVLIYRTNNVETVGYHFTSEDIHLRSVGSKLVLPGRIFYAMFIWFCKLTVSEFLKRITIRIWRPAYEATLRGIRVFLLLTFGAVVIATLTECHPLDHYWQVIPDPGPNCRLGYAHLFTMGICDIITDFLLILFPIPIVLMSGQTWKRKLELLSLFSLSVFMIVITVTRMTMVIRRQGLQQYRTVWASCEILASAATCNAVVLGSFVRGKGLKKNRYVWYSVSDSIDRVSTRRPTLCSFGSDDDLIRSVGYRPPEDVEAFPRPKPRPALSVSPRLSSFMVPTFASTASGSTPMHRARVREHGDALVHGFVLGRVLPSPSISTCGSGSMTDSTTISEGGGSDQKDDGSCYAKRPSRVRSSDASIVAYDFATPLSSLSRHITWSDSREEIPTIPPHRRGSLSRHPFHFLQRNPSSQSGLPFPPTGIQGPILERYETGEPLQDVGGLLRRESTSRIPHDHFRPWPEPADGLVPPVMRPTANYPETRHTLTLEDIGGLLSGTQPQEGVVESRHQTKSVRQHSLSATEQAMEHP